MSISSAATRRFLQHGGLALSLSAMAIAGCATPTTPASSLGDSPAGAVSMYTVSGTSLTATASNTNSTYVASRAVDGDTNTEWQSGAVANPWLTVTLPASATLTALHIKTNPGAGTYSVSVSNDGSSFTPVLTNQSNSDWNVETKTLPAGTTGRYIRLNFSNSSQNVMVFEVSVDETAASAAPSIAPSSAVSVPPTGAPAATASNTNGSFAASRAIDGDTNTEWQSGTVANPWLLIDRGSLMTLSGLAIKTNPNVGSYAVDVSNDGQTWTTILQSQTNTDWNLESKSVPAGTVARFVKLRFSNNSQNVMVFEVQTPGSAVATAPSAAPSAAPSSAPTAAPTTAPTAAPSTQPSVAPVSGGISTYFGNASVPKVGSSYTQGFALMSDLGMDTIREGWNWKNIETGNNQYVSWMSLFDSKMAQFKQMGDHTMVMICDTPSWASSDGTQYGVPNGLNQAIFADGTDVYKPGVGINPNNTYAAYVYYLASRYKGEISYYQAWNEPDFPSGDTGAGSTGSTNGAQRSWTGSVQDYVRLLKVTATIVRGVDPGAKVALGGLGYENYLGAIVDNGGAPYFDVVDFHAYGSDTNNSNDVLNTSWGFLGRYQAMKKMLASKGVTGKTFGCSETGYTANNQGEQAAYVPKLFASAVGAGDIEEVQWAVFTNPGFNNIGLIDSATLSQKTQGYTAYKYASSQLTGATCTGTLSGTGVQGYTFRRADGKSLLVAWSTAASASVTPSFGSGQEFDKLGNAKGSYGGGAIALTSDPVYVVGN